MPVFSVIIPSYNSAHFLDDAIWSVLQQTNQDFEIVVVDDGSTDGCLEVVERYPDQVRYLRQENQGLAGARNTGIWAAKGSYIALLDADDQWMPDFLESMAALIEAHSDAAVYYACAQCMDANGNDLPRILGGPIVAPDEIYQQLLRANFLIPSTVVVRRAVAIEADLFDRSLRSCEDWDLWLRILPEQKFIGTSRCLTRYRLHGSSLSDNLDGMYQAATKVVQKNFGDDNGQPQAWTPEKRRAYGGLYRYQAVTLVQRNGDWRGGAEYLRRALSADRSIAGDLDLFYDLAYGSQPAGFRGTEHMLELQNNEMCMVEMLQITFDDTDAAALVSLHGQAYGTAYFALGLLAYNTSQLDLSRRYLTKALRYRPDLWRETRVSNNLLKSIFGNILIDRMKDYGRKARDFE